MYVRPRKSSSALAPTTTAVYTRALLSGSITERTNRRRLKQVKLVLAAAMWMRPHLLVLDEPTNYLDREALGALTQGIKEFGGGVIIISHNSEFINAITTETWLLEAGRLQTIGGAQEVRRGGEGREAALMSRISVTLFVRNTELRSRGSTQTRSHWLDPISHLVRDVCTTKAGMAVLRGGASRELLVQAPSVESIVSCPRCSITPVPYSIVLLLVMLSKISRIATKYCILASLPAKKGRIQLGSLFIRGVETIRFASLSLSLSTNLYRLPPPTYHTYLNSSLPFRFPLPTAVRAEDLEKQVQEDGRGGG